MAAAEGAGRPRRARGRESDAAVFPGPSPAVIDPAGSAVPGGPQLSSREDSPGAEGQRP